MEKTILVIEDNNDIRENTAEILELAGYRALTAENGKRGVELAIKEKPSVIVCDIMMPELDGYGVLHLLRKNAETQNTPFIFLTAKTERGDFRKGMEMGADDYITKPFEDIELLNAVEIRLKKSEILEQKYVPSPQGLTQFLKDIKSTGLIQKLSDQYDVETYDKKRMLYNEGKRPRFLYYLVKGKLKGYKVHEDGKEYIITPDGPKKISQLDAEALSRGEYKELTGYTGSLLLFKNGAGGKVFGEFGDPAQTGFQRRCGIIDIISI